MEIAAQNQPSTSPSCVQPTTCNGQSNDEFNLELRFEKLIAELESLYGYLWLRSRETQGGWVSTKEKLFDFVNQFSDDEIQYAIAMCKALKTPEGNYRLPLLMELESFAKQRQKEKTSSLQKLEKPKPHPEYYKLISEQMRKLVAKKEWDRVLKFNKFLSENQNNPGEIVKVLKSLQEKENQQLQHAA